MIVTLATPSASNGQWDTEGHDWAALGAAAETSEWPWDARLAVECAYLSEVESLTSAPRGGGVLGLDR